MSYKGVNIKAINVPANQCPKCKKIKLDELIQERILKYAQQKNQQIVIMQYQDEESTSSQFFL